MRYQLLLAICLCAWLPMRAQAGPITWNQLAMERSFPARPSAATAGLLAASVQESQDQRPRAEEGSDHPPFVRLLDGRIVPYGQGVICAEDCVEGFEATPPRPRLWFFLPPVIGGGIACAVLCGSTSGPPGNPRLFNNSPNPLPIPAPTPTPPAQVSPAPEPATLVLLGVGLALLSRKRSGWWKAQRRWL